jgi:hypothetical protein
MRRLLASPLWLIAVGSFGIGLVSAIIALWIEGDRHEDKAT